MPRRPGTVFSARSRSATAASSAGRSALTRRSYGSATRRSPSTSTFSRLDHYLHPRLVRACARDTRPCRGTSSRACRSARRRPSSVSSAWPADGHPLARDVRVDHEQSEARGSCSRCRGFARPSAVLNETLPSSTSTQTIVECGDPSARSVVTTPTNGFSSRNFRVLLLQFQPLPTSCSPDPETSRGGSVFPDGRPLTRRDAARVCSCSAATTGASWEVEGPLLAGWSSLPRDRRSTRRRAPTQRRTTTSTARPSTARTIAARTGSAPRRSACPRTAS